MYFVYSNNNFKTYCICHHYGGIVQIKVIINFSIVIVIVNYIYYFNHFNHFYLIKWFFLIMIRFLKKNLIFCLLINLNFVIINFFQINNNFIRVVVVNYLRNCQNYILVFILNIVIMDMFMIMFMINYYHLYSNYLQKNFANILDNLNYYPIFNL